MVQSTSGTSPVRAFKDRNGAVLAVAVYDVWVTDSIRWNAARHLFIGSKYESVV